MIVYTTKSNVQYVERHLEDRGHYPSYCVHCGETMWLGEIKIDEKYSQCKYCKRLTIADELKKTWSFDYKGSVGNVNKWLEDKIVLRSQYEDRMIYEQVIRNYVNL